MNTKQTQNTTPDAVDKSDLTITGLVSYRLQLVGNLMSRSAAMFYRRRFDVSLWEWRTLALLGARPDKTLNDLAKVVDLDKGLASRVVSALAERGLVQRRTDEQDARAVRLRLTEEGEQLYSQLIKGAAARNAAFLQALTPEEWAVLDRALIKLEQVGRASIEEEKQLAATEGPPKSSHK